MANVPSGLIRFIPHFPFSATISPHAPPTFELISKAFHKWYIDVGPGMVPTSRRTQTLGWRMGPKALKNHRWELIFFWFFSLRQKITWTGTTPFSAPSIFIEGDTETENRVNFGTPRKKKQTEHTLCCVLVNMCGDGFAVDNILSGMSGSMNVDRQTIVLTLAIPS